MSTLHVAATIDTGLLGMVTAADVSPDDGTVVVRTYTSLLAYERPPGASLTDALAGQPCSAAAPAEPQGEAVAFLADGQGVVTLSEGGEQPLWLVPAAG